MENKRTLSPKVCRLRSYNVITQLAVQSHMEISPSTLYCTSWPLGPQLTDPVWWAEQRCLHPSLQNLWLHGKGDEGAQSAEPNIRRLFWRTGPNVITSVPNSGRERVGGVMREAMSERCYLHVFKDGGRRLQAKEWEWPPGAGKNGSFWKGIPMIP